MGPGIALAALLAAPPAAGDRVQVRLDVAQAEAVLAILARRAAGEAVRDRDWAALFATEGQVRLKERETSLGRRLDDADFRAFVLGDGLARRRDALAATLERWRKADLAAATARALAYLPDRARIRATVYPVIKPRSNSFVFEADTRPAIFLYLDPEMAAPAFENTVAHELHHIGFASVAGAHEAQEPERVRPALRWLGALGEGFAVLAAAGSADVHPLAAFPEADRVRWDQDMEGFDQALQHLDRFFLDIVQGGFRDPEVIDHVAFTFFGYRGPWYLVGYRMAVEIERRFGRATVIECMADPRLLLARYDEAARQGRSPGGEPLPRFSPELLAALGVRP